MLSLIGFLFTAAADGDRRLLTISLAIAAVLIVILPLVVVVLHGIRLI